MSRQQTLAAHYTRLLRRWPTDRLRPEERTFQRLLQSRIQYPPPQTTETTATAEKECNAAYLLLDNALTKRFPLGKKIMKPASDPEHYVRIEKEVQELPDRNWVGRMVRKLQGMVRMS